MTSIALSLNRFFKFINHPVPRASKKELRQFGFLMAGFLAGMFGGFFPWLLSKPTPVWPFYPASFFAAFAIAWPSALGPIHQYWMKFSHVLGYFNSRILLGLVYYVVVFPMGVARRIFGKDAMARKFEKDTVSYRIDRACDKNQSNMERPY